MERRLLFISKYPDIIQEFVDAMGEKEIEIDTASNGIEAAARLKKKEYQIVVTGVSLDGYNGEQIITYLNKNYPNTVCIIYTTTISPAQLHFFINERNVFRVFLRPVDFHREFFAALEEAFEYYDLCEKVQEEAAHEDAELERKRKEIIQIERRLDSQKQTQQDMESYLKRMFGMTLEEYGEQMDPARREQMKSLEWEIVELCCEREGDTKEALMRAQQKIQRLRNGILE